MNLRRLMRWLWLMPVIGAVVLGGWLARAKLNAWTRWRLTQQRLDQIGALPEAEAAEIIRRTPEIDAEAIEILGSALADERPLVAAAARSALAALLEAWQELPVDERSRRAEMLASALARNSPKFSEEALAAAQGAAQLLLYLPANGRRIDAARLIADCETILRIGAESAPDSIAAEPRLGALPATNAIDGRVQ